MQLGWTVVVDANVLVPVVSCDFVLTAFDRGLVETSVSSVTLDEVERTLVEDFSHLDPAALRRRVDAMRVVLEDHIIDSTPDAEELGDINDKDRHVVACAIEAGATLVVTNDRRLRSEIAAARRGIDAVDGDQLGVRLYDVSADAVWSVIEALAAKRRDPQVTPAEMVEQLRVPFPSMIARLRGDHPGT